MKIQYYNTLEFKKIIKRMTTDPIRTLKEFEDYLKEYPKDYTAYFWYIENLICLGYFEKAEKVYNHLDHLVINDKNFSYEKNKMELYNKHKFYVTLKLLSYQEKYKELYTFCLNNLDKINKLKISHVLFWCRTKLGKINPDKRETNLYLFRQMVEYKENDFLENSKKHRDDNNEIEKINSIFKHNFPFEEILTEIKQYIPSKNCIYPRLFEDEYIFKYNECGRSNNKLANYFKVICFHNTNNIITMYPCNNCEKLPCIDLNYLIKNEPTENKIKRLSQTDKFNKKYNRK